MTSLFSNLFNILRQHSLYISSTPNYETFSNINAAYADFIGKFMSVINKIAPIKTIRAKNHTEEWLDGEILDSILVRDKAFQKFKNSKLQVDKEIYKAGRNKVQNLVIKKKKMFYEEKLRENIGKPNELWKTINSLGLAWTPKSDSKTCLKDKEQNLYFDAKTNGDIFKDFLQI